MERPEKQRQGSHLKRGRPHQSAAMLYGKGGTEADEFRARTPSAPSPPL